MVQYEVRPLCWKKQLTVEAAAICPFGTYIIKKIDDKMFQLSFMQNDKIDELLDDSDLDACMEWAEVDYFMKMRPYIRKIEK